MENFLHLINSIDTMSDEELDGLQAIVDSLPNNAILLKQIKEEYRNLGMPQEEILQEKEGAIEFVDKAIEHKKDKLTDRALTIASSFKEAIVILYDKLVDNYDRMTVEIPVEIADTRAKLPEYAHSTDAGFDFYLIEDLTLEPHSSKIAPTGLKMAIPEGYELQVRPRSGTSIKTALRIANAPGTIDSGYRGDIGIICWNSGDAVLEFKAGDRIAQGVLSEVPKGLFTIVDDVSKIGRDRQGGFGSTGK